MKIAIVIRRLSGRGGLESNVLAFARYLLTRGHRVTVICQRAEAELDAEIITVRAPSVLGEAAKMLLFARAAAKSVAELAPDVSYTASHAYGVRVVRLETGLSVDYREAIHRTAPAFDRLRVRFDPAERAAVAIEKRKIEEARLVLALSELDRRRVLALYGIDPARVRVARNGIDLARFQVPSAQDRAEAKQRFGVRTHAIGFVGSGFFRKGLKPLLAALAEPTAPKDSTLLIAGTDRLSAEYAAEAKARGVDARFLGHVADVRPLLAAVDALAMPSLYDPYPLAVLEALACGVPVVLSAISGATEILPHRELILEDPTDAPALARALARAVTIDAREQTRRAVEPYSIESSLAALEAALIEAAV